MTARPRELSLSPGFLRPSLNAGRSLPTSLGKTLPTCDLVRESPTDARGASLWSFPLARLNGPESPAVPSPALARPLFPCSPCRRAMCRHTHLIQFSCLSVCLSSSLPPSASPGHASQFTTQSRKKEKKPAASKASTNDGGWATSDGVAFRGGRGRGGRGGGESCAFPPLCTGRCKEEEGNVRMGGVKGREGAREHEEGCRPASF